MEEALFRIAQEALTNSARHAQATQVELALTSEQDRYTLMVDDNGQGFDSATVQGKGIRLRSMQERIHAVSGTLNVTSALGKGTRVTARCPAFELGEGAEERRNGANYDSHRRYDPAIVRHGVRTFLEMESDLLVLQEADSGEAAVCLAAELIPDVVLMDLMLPGMSGVEAIRQIKQASPETQIIALTSYHEDAFIFPALRAGALSYVLKDVHPEARRRKTHLSWGVGSASPGGRTRHPGNA